MPRRQPSTAELLILAPWWVSLILAGVAYLILTQWVPTIQTDNPMIKVLIGIAPMAAVFIAIVLLLLSLVSAVRSWANSRLLERQSSLESLRSMPWKAFEDVVAEAYRRQGYRVEEQLGGRADGGVDLVLRRDGKRILVQCKRWKGKQVGVSIARELFGVMAAEGVEEGHLVATTEFSRDAVAFASGKHLKLIDGAALLQMMAGVQESQRIAAQPAPEENSPSSTEQSCPACGALMVRRTARRGDNAGKEFWGCSTYPKCRGTLPG